MRSGLRKGTPVHRSLDPTYGRKKSSSIKLFTGSAIRSTTKPTKMQPSVTHQSQNLSDNEASGCALAFCIIVLIGFIALFLWSFTWSWESYTYPLEQRIDYGWLKVIFYPVVIGIIGFTIALIVSYIKEGQKNNT